MRITRKTGPLVGNKVIAAQDEQRARRIHESKLQTMRPSVDTAQPEHFGKMKVNRKRAQLEEERLCEIEKQNGKLLDKLTQIAAKKGVTDLKPATAGTALLKGEACETRSLNEKARKLELQRIQHENLQILKRIQQSQEKSSPEINHASLEKAWSETARYRKLASQL